MEMKMALCGDVADEIVDDSILFVLCLLTLLHSDSNPINSPFRIGGHCCIFREIIGYITQ